MQSKLPAQLTMVDRSPIDERGIEASGPDERGIDASGIDASGVDESGMDESGMDESGMDESGMEERGIELKGIEERGAPANANVSKVTDEAVEGVPGSMPRLGQFGPNRLLSVAHHVVSTSVSVGAEPSVLAVPGSGNELSGTDARATELRGTEDRGELDRPRSARSTPVLSKRPAATAVPMTWARLTDCKGSPSKLVPARTPGQPLQVVPEQPGGYVMVSSESGTLPRALAAAAMAASGLLVPVAIALSGMELSGIEPSGEDDSDIELSGAEEGSVPDDPAPGDWGLAMAEMGNATSGTVSTAATVGVAGEMEAVTEPV